MDIEIGLESPTSERENQLITMEILMMRRVGCSKNEQFFSNLINFLRNS